MRTRICVAKCIIILKYNLGQVNILSAVKNAVVKRFEQICNEQGIAKNELANISGVTPSTVYSLFKEERQNVSITTIKILCDGLGITLGEFFNSNFFDELDQEIK